ncbi:Uncharacterised protein [Mycobacteroides abscessus subsp. abscessus]|nr:Uncharacterised protein [Mycobacteroides abscessus subsp. abscessus]
MIFLRADRQKVTPLSLAGEAADLLVEALPHQSL